MTASRLGRSLSLLSGLSSVRNDESYRLLLENQERAVLFATLPGGEICDANLKALKLTGYSRPELRAFALSDLISPNKEDGLLQHLSALEPGVTRDFADVTLRTHADEAVQLNVRAARAAESEELLMLLLTPHAQTGDDPEGAVADESGRALHSLAALIALLQTPSSDALADAVPLCRVFLGADSVALYSATVQPGFTLLAAAPEGGFPNSVEATDAAVGPALFEWRAATPAASVLARMARDRGHEVLLAHPLGDRVGCSGVLVALYQTGARAALRGPARMEVAARTLTVFMELHGRLQAAHAHSLHEQKVERRWRALLQATGDGVITLNAEGKIERINAPAERLLGYQQPEIVGMPLRDVLVAAQPVAGAVLAALRKGEAYGGNDISLVRRDGLEVHVQLRAVPVRGHEPGNTGGLITISDHSERKAMEAKAQHLEQRAILGDLSAIFAHEIRNPLNGITTGLQYLQMQLGPEDGLQESVESILDETTRISRLLQDILLIVKPKELVIEAADLGAGVRALAERWRERLHGRGIKLDVEVDESTPPALADTDQMEQVFTNLLSNAMHAMDVDGGTVTVTVQPALPQLELRGEHVQINIADSGPGMPPDVKEQVFNPFYTTKREGTGLGLAISQRIVNAHRGTLSVESTPTIGTVFMVVLPAAPSGENT